ncbi:MAG: hypothetical protein ISS23_02310 [Nanoarchaeota archaeon]|nr:hypothetical protein [Nanoarchaeota archaeon]
MTPKDLEKRLVCIFDKPQACNVLESNDHKDSFLSSFLIRNPGTKNKSWSLREYLIADYANLENYVDKSKLLEECNKKVSRKTIQPNKKIRPSQGHKGSNYLLASNAYLQLLKHPDSKKLINQACDLDDLKAIVYVDVLLDKLGVAKCKPVVQSGICLGDKVKQLAKIYDQKKIYGKIRVESGRVQYMYENACQYLEEGRLTRDKVQNFRAVKSELLGILRKWDSFPSGIREDIHNDYIKVKHAATRIDSVFKKYENNVDKRLAKVKFEFRDGVWNTGARINRLHNLSSNLNRIIEDYNLIDCKEGVKTCKDLNSKINSMIKEYNYSKDIECHFKNVKREIPEIRKKVKFIFKEDCITSSSIKKLNKVYSRLKKLHNQSFSNCIPNDHQEKYYSALKTAIDFVEEKCAGRAYYLLNRCEKYRNKLDKSRFSWTTKKFTEKLKEYNNKLEVWEKCRAI